MEMKPVKRSQIKSIGHDPTTNTLAVEFNSGGVYHYAGVDSAAYNNLVAADSIGKHFHAHIRSKHEHTKQGKP